MTDFLVKHYKKFTFLGLAVIIITLTGGLIFGPFNEILPDDLRKKLGYSNDLEDEFSVRLIVNFNSFCETINHTIFFKENEIATAYTVLLKANLTVKIKEYQNGLFIEAIEGIEQNEHYYWWYQVDGRDGGVASSKFDLRANNIKIIKWMYKSY